MITVVTGQVTHDSQRYKDRIYEELLPEKQGEIPSEV